VPAGTPRALAEPTTTKGQIFSEHDPVWRIATVAIDDVQQGTYASKTVDVRFASSTDVAWFDAPKFHPGQEGYFLLHREAAGAKMAKEAIAADAGDYVALHPTDFQPIEQPGGVKAVVGSSSSRRR
jgi:hypothetical protein